MTEEAQVTLVWNGVTEHTNENHSNLGGSNSTNFSGIDHGSSAAGIKLQNEGGHRVSFRNIWIIPLTLP